MPVLRALFVEDSEDDAMLIVDHLQGGGYEVEFERVDTAVAMNKAIEAHSWDVVLCDYTLPYFDGAAAIALSKSINPYVPVIVISGTIGEDLAVGALKLGANDYILKGNLVRLIPAIERSINECELLFFRDQNEKSNKEQASLLDKASDAICLIEPDGKVTYWNKGAERIYGWNSEEILGKNIREFTKSDISRVEVALEALYREGEWSGEYDDLTKSGNRVTVYSRWTLLKGGEVEGKGRGSQTILVLNSDITEQKRLQLQVSKQQRMDSIGKLTGGVAHDFNNILTIILGQAEVGLLELESDHPVVEILTEIQEASQRAADLTHQLLAFSSKAESKPATLQINETVRSLENMLRRLIPENIQIDVSLAPDLPNVSFHSSQLEQVIVNFVVNARDAMPDGGNLSISTALRTVTGDDDVELADIAVGSYVVLEVKDTGCGIPAPIQDRIFEPFFSTKGAQGTGLGLSTVYDIVERNHGNIRFDTSHETGTAFQVFLSRAKNTSTAAKKIPDSQPTLDGRETVLLVEDDELLRKLVSKVLRKFGYAVLEAATPADALRHATQNADAIQCLLTDVIMPGMDGFELAEAVRKKCPDVRVRYMSGYFTQELLAKYPTAREQDLLPKPFTTTALLSRVRETLDEDRN